MIQMIRRIKDKLQFNSYSLGYSKGYYHACKKLKVKNGRYAILKHEDVVLGSQFYKRPRFRLQLFPWISGFEFGMTDAYSFYNAGDDPYYSEESIEDIIKRVKAEYEKDKDRNNGWKNNRPPFSQMKQLP